MNIKCAQINKIKFGFFIISLTAIFSPVAYGQEKNDLFHNESEWTRSCAVPAVTSPKQVVIPEIFPVVVHGTPGRNLGSEQLFAPVVSIAFPIANLASDCMAGNSSACGEFSDWVGKLADMDALKFDREKHKDSQSSLVTGELSGNSTLRPIAIYTSMLRRRNLIALADRDKVFGWMRRRALNYSHISGEENESQLAQNLVLSSAVTQLAVGIATSDPSLTVEAPKVFRAYIDTMRPDGSFPAETQRGQSALKYENNAIALLVLTAELEIVEGQNLYSYHGPNGDIHTAIKFWLSALQNESLIAKYAAADVAPTDPVQPDGKLALHFLHPERDMTQMGWVVPYMKRFPNGDNVKMLHQLISQGKFPILNDYDGIMTVYPECVWGLQGK